MRLIDADALIAEYDKVHVGPAGGARKLMEDAPTIKPELNCSEIPNNSDTISRQEAIEIADAIWTVTGDKNVAKVWQQLNDLPSVEPVRKKGRWILTQDEDYEYCTCSECGYQNGENWMNGADIPFCAMCGSYNGGEEIEVN